jgi:putative hydrolase of the HAD superfamily
MKKYKALAFDLDDTLLDTSQLLVPGAAARACESMIAQGLHCDLPTCLARRKELAHEMSHPDIFAHIVMEYGCDHPHEAVQQAVRSFYNPLVPDSLPLMEQAEENLRVLGKDYRLFLVTLGSPATQTKKIRALNLEKYFAGIFILDGFKGETKRSAFEKILKEENIAPHELLSIGNRLCAEIRDAKKCGGDTCYFAYGEHVGEQPERPEDRPDFTIRHHRELIPTCRL